MSRLSREGQVLVGLVLLCGSSCCLSSYSGSGRTPPWQVEENDLEAGLVAPVGSGW